MSNVVFFNTYKLRKGASIPDFLLTVENLNNEHISKQEGYISFELDTFITFAPLLRYDLAVFNAYGTIRHLRDFRVVGYQYNCLPEFFTADL